MTQTPGTRFDRYEVVDLVGAGAMGEVYRARDTRLGRNVALKVLPAHFSSDPDRLRRFDQEARSAGTLNHPNVVAIFDVGTQDDMPFVVSELLEGETLRQRLERGALPVRKAIEYGVQIARGLAAAHAQGVVHRDHKPENLFVTADGQVKILDFGLAKLVRPESGPMAGRDSLAGTMTEAGMIMGTAGYMAPEQVRGEAADQRSDLFALGCVLYEMVAGGRAFQGASPLETLYAILNADPAPLPVALKGEAPGLAAIVLRCLEKLPGERFESARDLAFALSVLPGAAREAAAPAADSAAAPPAALSVPDIRFRRLTFQRGTVLRARFTPDGYSVVYGGAWEGKPVDLFWMHIGTPEGRLLASGADIFGVGPTGEMAICLARRQRSGFVTCGTLARLPLGGGAPRQMLDDVDEAAWGPQGSQLAVVHEVEGRSTLEYPLGRVLFRTTGWLSHPRVSWDGAHVAFLHHELAGNDGGAVMVVDQKGHARTLSDGWGTIRGLAWSADGSEVWFTAHREGGGRSLYAVSLEGSQRTLVHVPGQLCIQDIARDGRALVTHSMERQAILVRVPGEAQERDLSWLDWSLLRDFTADGRLMLFVESGEGGGPSAAICVRPTDGTSAVRLGDGVAMQFSPDGKWVLARQFGESSQEGGRLMLLPTGVGTPREIPTPGLECLTAKFLPDGESLILAANESGQPTRLYHFRLATGERTPVGPEGPVSIIFEVSPDGAFVAAQFSGRPWMLYPVAGGEPRPIPALEPHDEVLPWTVDPGWLLVQAAGQMPARIHRIDLATGHREPWREVAPPDATGVYSVRGFRFARDEETCGYTYTIQLDDLYLVEGLR